MDLRCKTASLVGQALNVGGRNYGEWEGEVLKGLTDEDAKSLLSLKHFVAAKAKKVPLKVDAPPKVETPEDEIPAEEKGDGEEGEESYTAESLGKLTKAELLEFFAEDAQAEAVKLTKPQLVDYILKGE